MGIYITDLRELVIRPTLEHLDEWSPTAENLLLGTAAQESQLGFRLHLNPDKGAGIYRISAQTHVQIWDHYLVSHHELASRIRGLASQQQFLRSPHQELITNLSYATGIAWMIYKRNLLKLPDADNIHELAQAWRDAYATREQKILNLAFNSNANIEKFVANYRKQVLRENKKIAA